MALPGQSHSASRHSMPTGHALSQVPQCCGSERPSTHMSEHASASRPQSGPAPSPPWPPSEEPLTAAVPEPAVPATPPVVPSVPALPPVPALADAPAEPPVPPVCFEPPTPEGASGASVQPPKDHTNKSAPSGTPASFPRPPRQYVSLI